MSPPPLAPWVPLLVERVGDDVGTEGEVADGDAATATNRGGADDSREVDPTEDPL